jgi:hypothetical protein
MQVDGWTGSTCCTIVSEAVRCAVALAPWSWRLGVDMALSSMGTAVAGQAHVVDDVIRCRCTARWQQWLARSGPSAAQRRGVGFDGVACAVPRSRGGGREKRGGAAAAAGRQAGVAGPAHRERERQSALLAGCGRGGSAHMAVPWPMPMRAPAGSGRAHRLGLASFSGLVVGPALPSLNNG